MSERPSDPAAATPSPDRWPRTWVGQEDAEGCSIAALAMICGHTYAEVKATVTGFWPRDREQDWSKEGATYHTLDRYLAAHGYFLQRRYESWDLPMEPFAPIHYVSVQQPSNRGHFVVMFANGTVLDPLREGERSLADWPKVNQIVGLVRP